MIHVHDDRVGQSSDFTCSRAEIVKHMKYFERFLGESAASKSCDPDDVDISVHCDISVFEWLVKYMRSPNTGAATLAVPSVISILISSDFLQMGPLVDECLRFIHGHINQIVKLPIDFGCINPALSRRLAHRFSVDELDEVKDPRDKLLGQLYMKRLEIFLEEELPAGSGGQGKQQQQQRGRRRRYWADNSDGWGLAQCIHCKRLFTQQGEHEIAGGATPAHCPRAKMAIDYHGAVVARHQPNPEWSLLRYISRLRAEEKKSWREIYWHLWGLSHVMTCTVCNAQFSCAELGHCSYHPQSVRADASGTSTNEGVYPCCGQRVLNFDVANKSAVARQGCCARNHVVRAEGADATTLDTMLKRHSLVTVPFNEKASRLYDMGDSSSSGGGGGSGEGDSEQGASDGSTTTSTSSAGESDAEASGSEAVAGSSGAVDKGSDADEDASVEYDDSAMMGWAADDDFDGNGTRGRAGAKNEEEKEEEGQGNLSGTMAALSLDGGPLGHASPGRVSSRRRRSRAVAASKEREALAAVREVPAHLNETRRRQWKQDAQRAMDAKRLADMCEQLLATRQLPKRINPATRAGKQHAGGERRVGKKGKARGATRHSTSKPEHRERKQRPGSAASYLIVRKQAHERRTGAWSGSWTLSGD